MRNQRPRYVEERITACLSEHGTLGFAALLQASAAPQQSNIAAAKLAPDAPRRPHRASRLCRPHPPRVLLPARRPKRPTEMGEPPQPDALERAGLNR